MNNNMESTPPDLRTVEGDDQSTPEELLVTTTMTIPTPDVEETVNKITICEEHDGEAFCYCRPEDVNKAITETYQAGIDEVVEIVEAIKLKQEEDERKWHHTRPERNQDWNEQAKGFKIVIKKIEEALEALPHNQPLP